MEMSKKFKDLYLDKESTQASSKKLGCQRTNKTETVSSKSSQTMTCYRFKKKKGISDFYQFRDKYLGSTSKHPALVGLGVSIIS